VLVQADRPAAGGRHLTTLNDCWRSNDAGEPASTEGQQTIRKMPRNAAPRQLVLSGSNGCLVQLAGGSVWPPWDLCGVCFMSLTDYQEWGQRPISMPHQSIRATSIIQSNARLPGA